MKRKFGGEISSRKQVKRILTFHALAGLLFMAMPSGTAQVYTVLHAFTGGWDGQWPDTRLEWSGTNLFGTARAAGTNGFGLVFKLNTDGGNFTALKYFLLRPNGQHPRDLELSGGVLFGTALDGGLGDNNGGGVVFKLNTDGTDFAAIHRFTWGGDAYLPGHGVLVSGATLFGTTTYAGTNYYASAGAVFKVGTDGGGFAVLKQFAGTDGSAPNRLLLSGTTLFGTTGYGGFSNNGTVFKLNTDGSGFTLLKQFTNASDGANPFGGLVLSGTNLFGTTEYGGSANKGTVFRINTDGSGFTLLKQFTGLRTPQDTNGDGACPYSGLMLSGNTLYGTTCSGGSYGMVGGGSQGYGTIFKLDTDGGGYAVIKRFTGLDGAIPYAPVVLRGTTLFGTTSYGGGPNDWGNGVVFSLSLPSPPIILVPPESHVEEIGRTASLQVIVDGTQPLNFQWLFQDTNALAGATNSILQLVNVQPAQAGAYTVVITNVAGAATSAPVRLDVIAVAPAILTPPMSQTRTLGSSAYFSVNVDGSMPLSYQWFFNVANALPGATNSVLKLTSLQSAQAGDYTVQITNAFGAITSPPATLALIPPLVVTNCTEADLAAAIARAGTVTFDCDGTIALSNTIPVASDTTLDGNGHQVAISGGNAVRIFIVATNVSFTVANLTLVNGRSDSGAGIFNDGGGLTITNCRFIANCARGVAGDVGSTGQSGTGGALYNLGVVTADNCTFISNSAVGGAGGLGSSAINYSNYPTAGPGGIGGDGDGGAICNFGSLTLSSCLLACNSACGGVGGDGGFGGFASSGPGYRGGSGGAGGDGKGGALFNGGSVVLLNNTIALNAGVGAPGGYGGSSGFGASPDYPRGSDGNGGTGGSGYGAVCDVNGQCFTTNCTLALNCAIGGTGGHGSLNGANGTARGGGLWATGTTLVNTLLAGSTPSNFCGSLTDNGHNLSSDASIALAGAGSRTNINPLLGPLADNGGPTLTMALLPGSPAIDAGSAVGAPATDQRGVPRPQGPEADIGAFEVQSVPFFSGLAIKHGTNFQLQLTGFLPDQTFTIQGSSNLFNWFTITSFAFGTNPLFELFDPMPTNCRARFYRVKSGAP